MRLTKTESATLYERADEAGRKAAADCAPTPMTVYEPGDPVASLLGQDDGGIATARRVYEPVADGVCGFAWVTVRPGTCSFARWLAANKGASRGYYGGTELWIGAYRQSYQLKLAYATAFAGVLRDAGIDASAGGRLD